ncbi:MAG: hypothetical protein V4813_01455 [Gemmatimonadota bacterium]
MTISRTFLVGACAVLSAATASAQPDARFNADFDRADRRASQLVDQLRCGQRMASLRARGRFGAPDTLGFVGHCVLRPGAYIGVYLDLDSTRTRAVRFSALDITHDVPYREALDTAALVAASRARYDALGRGGSTMARQFVPFMLRGDADSVEVWLVPVSIFTGEPVSAGGERGYVYDPAGRTLARTVDNTAAYQVLTAPDSARLTIARPGVRIPGLSDLLLANLLLLEKRTLSIELADVTSTLLPGNGDGMWVHTKRAAR